MAYPWPVMFRIYDASQLDTFVATFALYNGSPLSIRKQKKTNRDYSLLSICIYNLLDSSNSIAVNFIICHSNNDGIRYKVIF